MAQNRYALAGQCVLLTGAGSIRETEEFGRIEGIGSGIARVLVENGCNIVFTYNRSAEGAAALADELRTLRPEVHIEAVQYSAADYASAAPRLAAQAVETMGRIDLLVNNLGTSYVTDSGIPHEEPTADIEELMRVNFFSAYELAKRVLERMVSQDSGGRLVNVSSCSVSMPHSKRTGYGITKHAVHGMLNELASYYGRHDIKVIELQLGVFETLMTLPRLAFYREASQRGAIPLPRLGRPEEVGHLVAFFASGACDYLHGAAIRVDGGLTIRSFDRLSLEG